MLQCNKERLCHSMKETFTNLWHKLKAWKFANIALWSSATVIVIALGIVIALTVGGGKPDSPSISHTTPTSTTATTPNNNAPTDNSDSPDNGGSSNNGGFR